MRRFFSIIVCILLLYGCTTLDGIRKSQGMGKTMIFQYPYDKVYQVCLSGLLRVGLQVVEQDKNAGYLIATNEMSLLSCGERIAVFVREVNDNTTKVEVVSKALVKTNLFAHDWTHNIFQEISLQLQ